MSGRLETLNKQGGKRICYSCGNCYPDTVRFCPNDSVDLEYLPSSIEALSRDFRRPRKGVAAIVIAAFLLVLGAYVGFSRLNAGQNGNAHMTSGVLMVNTIPAGAMVYLDGSHVGVSPVRLFDIPTGVHEVRAVFPGYSDGTAHVQILPSATQKLVWDLSPLPQRKTRLDRGRYLAWNRVRDITAATKTAFDNLI